MKNYDAVILFHPNQSSLVPDMVERYENQIKAGGGQVHLTQDLERKKIHYTIRKYRSSKAHFFIINFSGELTLLNELQESFKFNDVIMRHLVVERKLPRTEKLVALLEKDERAPFVRGGKVSLLSDAKIKAYDMYLQIAFLREHTLVTGRIMPARLTGMSPKQQRQFTRAVKWARFLGLMCYCDRHA